MKKIILSVASAVVFVIIIIIFCYRLGEEPSKVPFNKTFELSKCELIYYKLMARIGSIDATSKLYGYYELWKFDREGALPWLKRGAELGDSDSQYALGYEYLFSHDIRDYDRAREWLQKSCDNGNPRAKELLDNFDKYMHNEQK